MKAVECLPIKTDLTLKTEQKHNVLFVCIYKRNQIMKSGFYALELGIFKISVMLKSILYLLPGPGCSKAD